MTKANNSDFATSSNCQIVERVTAAATLLELDVSRETLQKIYCYVEHLQKWNRTYNLTALRNFDDILIHHIFDCMAIIPVISSLTGGKKFTLVDVGSGAGLPGLVIAAWFPESQVVCVDSVEKKTTFIRYVAGRMACVNVQALHKRIEDIPILNAEIVISRAFASLKLFSELAGKHVSEGGWLLSMKAAMVNEDIAELESSEDKEWKVSLTKQLTVPESVASRYLVGLQRNRTRWIRQ